MLAFLLSFRFRFRMNSDFLCRLPINGLNADYGAFYITRCYSQWRTLLFSPMQLIATAVDHYDAALAACRYLEQANDDRLAIIIRNRKGGRNVGMVRWCWDSMGYGCTSEYWLRDYGGQYFGG